MAITILFWIFLQGVVLESKIIKMNDKMMVSRRKQGAMIQEMMKLTVSPCSEHRHAGGSLRGCQSLHHVPHTQPGIDVWTGQVSWKIWG